MKSSLNRQQVVWLVAGLLALGAAIFLAWFGLSEMEEKQAEAQALADRMRDPALAALLKDEGAMGKVNRDLAELQKLEQDLRKEVGRKPERWAEGTKEATGQGQEWAQDPGKWKDQLIRVVSDLQGKAPKVRLKIPPEFYLGLDGFRQKSPSSAEVPALALHLAVAQRLVEKLLEARKVREQYTTPCEIRSLVGPGTSAEKPVAAAPATPPARSAAPAVNPERQTFQMEIVSSPEVLYEYIRLLSTDEWLFVVRDLSVINQKQEFPPRSEIAKKFSSAEVSAPSGTGENKAAGKKLLEILAGDESTRTQMEIDFVAWKNPEEAASKPGGKP